MLINKKAVKQYSLDCASDRHHKFTRVSKEFFIYIESKIKTDIRNYIHSLPSVGKTIKSLIIFSFLICSVSHADYVVSLQPGQHARLAPHFTAKEFACPDCGVRKVNGKLLYRLELLRVELGGRPVTITSGYRCPIHNKKVGGKSHSQHLNGQAADVIVRGVSMAHVAEAARRVGFSFVLNEGDHVHVDVRG